MNNIVILKTSRLFRFFKFISKMPISSMYISYDKYDDEINSFNDVCTFVRHLLLTIFITIPVQLIMSGIILYLVFMGFLYLPGEALYNLLFGEQLEYKPIGYGMLITYMTIIGSYIALCIVQKFNQKVHIELKDDGAIKTAINIVSQKHSKFCKRLVVKSPSEVEQERLEKEAELAIKEQANDDEFKKKDSK